MTIIEYRWIEKLEVAIINLFIIDFKIKINNFDEFFFLSTKISKGKTLKYFISI